jgi:aminoglycoside phosphotransferase (APT) family kinase protein
VRDDLRAWVASEVGAVTAVAPIGSGASREIWRVDTADGPWVVRVDTGTGPVAGTPLDLTREAVVYAALRDTGLPVPRLRAVEPAGRALLMDLVDGEDALAGVGDADRRAAISRDYLGRLGQLHLLDPAHLDLPGWPHPVTGPDHALLDLALWATICEERAAGYTAPATPFALAWLGDHAPEVASRTSLCHGDAGPGNFLFSGASVSALLDWEFAHLGDPHDDLAWVAVRNHLLGRPIELPDAFARWREATGLEIESARLEYYRVLVLVRMAISCDATVAWKGGVEDDSIRTQVLLRPWLAVAITVALGLAGCTDAALPSLRADAEAALEGSSHGSLLALIPPLEPLEGL